MIDKELFNEGIKTVESELNDVKRRDCKIVCVRMNDSLKLFL